MTSGYKLRALDTMYSSRLLMTPKTPGLELRVLDAMNNLRLWMT